MKELLTYRPLPIPLNGLYGSTLHDWRYPPEPKTVAFFEKHLTKDDVIADIGANIGYFTRLFSKLAKRVVAFEPSPSTYRHLVKSTKGLPNVTTVNKGVYSQAGKLPLWSGDKSGHASLVHRAGTATEVDIIPLSDYPETFTWAKIDVEGAEMEILRSMKPMNCVVEASCLDMKEVAKTYDITDIGGENFYLKPNVAITHQ